VIPGTLLGALFLAACLVPGFVFLRVAEHHRAQLARSALVEAVELAGVGAATSLLSVMLVLSLDRWWDFLDASALANEPGTYLLLHPVRGLGSMLASFALSCLFAWLAALAAFSRRESVFEPGGSAWARMFFENRPATKAEVLVTVELKDGRRLAGRVGSFSAELEDSRELALVAPLAASPNAATRLARTTGDFIIVREEQIGTITGVYVDPNEARAAAPTPEPG
jgi:hypothetical protein